MIEAEAAQETTLAELDEIEAKLKHFVEQLLGGKVIRMDRQLRWRPAWYADIDIGGTILPLYLRGDREGDLSIFPDLRREADIIDTLHKHHIPVPRIYGFCEDPPTIVMDAIRGTRDFSQIERPGLERLGEDYMAAVAAMHRLPVDPFVAKGMRLPIGAEAVTLVGLEAYLPHYRKTKGKPEPLLEFAIKWLRRNAPSHRDRASFIQFDSGQFLAENGRMTSLYDFEFSMLGDPLVDIATMRMRDSIEPLPESMAVLCRRYAEHMGEAVDELVVEFHTLQFATLGTMQFAGAVAAPRPGLPHAVYLEWDLSLRRTILLAFGKLTGLPLGQLPVPPALPAGRSAAIMALTDTLDQLQCTTDLQQSAKNAANHLLEGIARTEILGPELTRLNLRDVAAVIGKEPASWGEAEALLEAVATTAGPEDDEKLLKLFDAIEARRMMIWGETPIGQSARNVAMPPLS